MRRLAISTLALLFAALVMPTQALAERVLVIATPNVPAGKFRTLATIGQRHGITLEHRYLQSIPAAVDGSLWRGYDAVFFDSYLQDAVRAKLVRALPELHLPNAWLYDQKPAWTGMPDAVGRRLVAHYSNGGERNFDAFFARLAAQLRGGEAGAIAEPVLFPKAAIYHPDAPGQVFADAAAYFRWKGIDAAQRPRRPVIAIAFHQQYLASMQTGLVDAFVRGIEQRGGIALAFYAPAMRGDGYAPLLMANGEALCDVLVNTQIVLDGEARRADFTRLARPVLQALSYRAGSADDWRADPTGVSLNDVPFYLAQPEYAGAIDAQVIAATRPEDDAVVPIPGQFETVLDKAFRIAHLRRTPTAAQRLALMFWNYPPGEKNLSASFLDVPESLQATTKALRGAGYRIDGVPADEAALVARLQRLLAPYYRDADLAALVASGDAAVLPVAEYRRWYEQLPDTVRAPIEQRWGEPEQSLLMLDREGEARFVIPRAEFGALVVLPQPPRGERWEDAEKALYHSTSAVPSHHYLATYLWLRQSHRSDALIHYGTHGSAGMAARQGTRTVDARLSDAGTGRPAGSLPLHRRQHR
jgi:cobaltochelatase CobN